MNNFAGLCQYAALQQVLAHRELSLTAINDVYLNMGTPLEVEWKNLNRCGSLTKKDVLRWSVDCSLIRSSECKIRSNFFKFRPSRHSMFYLVACSNTVSSYFTVGLCRIPLGNSSEVDDVQMKVAFSLMDMRDRCHHTCERIMKDCDAVQASFDRSCYSTHHLMFVREGCLRIHCALDVHEVLMEENILGASLVEETSPTVENLSQDLADDFRTLLNTGLHSDVTLRVGEQDIQAHRSILAARSPVFAAMFQHDTLEKNQNRVDIEDLSNESLSQLLRFLYTGETDELTAQELLSLFVAADKYNLPKLKKRCSSSLCSQITSEMALNVLVVANLHEDENLKQAAVHVVLDNAMDIMKSSEWLAFLKEYSEIANTIILNLAMKSLKTTDG